MTESSKLLSFSAWNPLRLFEGGQAPLNGQDQVEILQNSLFLDLPAEVRGAILQKARVAEHKSLRLACKLLKYDIENDVGVHVKLNAHNMPGGGWVGVVADCWTGLGTQEQQFIKRKIKWFGSVRVTSLNVKSLRYLPLPGEPFLRSPFSLKTLTLRCDEDLHLPNCNKALSLINTSSGLNTLDIVYYASRVLLDWHTTPPPSQASWDDIRSYNTKISNFFENMLLNLNGKPLENLRILMSRPKIGHRSVKPLYDPTSTKGVPRSRLKKWEKDEFYIGMPPISQSLQLEIPSALLTLKISALQFRDILEPYRFGSQLHIWKCLLDSQIQLTKLKVRIGMVYWKYFEIVLKKCYSTLKCVDFDVGNWEDPETAPDYTNVAGTVESAFQYIPEEDWFDWTALFTQDCNLESLSIRMPRRAHASANRTKNFCTTFEKLKKLKLHFVKLTEENLEQILLKMPKLKVLTLDDCHMVTNYHGNTQAYYRQFDNTFEWIREALQLERFDTIKLYGSIYIKGCFETNNRRFKQTAIRDPNYIVYWNQRIAEIPFYERWGGEPVLHIYRST